jgi:hypothetical protein
MVSLGAAGLISGGDGWLFAFKLSSPGFNKIVDLLPGFRPRRADMRVGGVSKADHIATGIPQILHVSRTIFDVDVSADLSFVSHET